MNKLTKEQLNDAIRAVLPMYIEQAAQKAQEGLSTRRFEPEAIVTQQDLLVFMTAFQWALADVITALLSDE